MANLTPMATGHSQWTRRRLCESPPLHHNRLKERRRALLHPSVKCPYPPYPRQASLHLRGPTVCVLAARRGPVSRCKFQMSRPMPVATLQSPALLVLDTRPTLRHRRHDPETHTRLASCSHHPHHLQPPHCSRPVRLGHQTRSHGLPTLTTKIT